MSGPYSTSTVEGVEHPAAGEKPARSRAFQPLPGSGRQGYCPDIRAIKKTSQPTPQTWVLSPATTMFLASSINQGCAVPSGFQIRLGAQSWGR